MSLPTIQQNNDLQQAVSARELHEFLDSGERFSRWFDRQLQYGFVNGQDYLGCAFTHGLANKEIQDYFISVDMAKEISMIQRSDKGKQARQYFIECERKTSQPVIELPDFTNPVEAARAFADQYEAKQIAQEQLAEVQPKVSFYDTVAASSSMMTVSDAAKKISMSAQELNKKLIAIGAYDKRRLPKKVFSHGFITKGYGVMKLTADGYDRNLLTQSGQIYVIGLFSRSRELEVV